MINAPENSAENLYINSASLNGKAYNKNWLSHSELLKGATIDFEMAAEPNKERGTKAETFPYSMSTEK